MKPRICLLTIIELIAGLILIPAGRVMAQTFTPLYSLTGYPYGGLVLSSNTLYGTTSQGGSFASGNIFAINTDGTDYTNLHSFDFGIDGARPYDGLILSGKTLYGTTSSGGHQGNGTPNLGIAGVVPAYELKDILFSKELKQQRGEQEGRGRWLIISPPPFADE